MQDQADSSNERPRIFHISSREQIKELRDQILKVNGFEVESMVYSSRVLDEVSGKDYDLVLIDVDKIGYAACVSPYSNRLCLCRP